MEKLLSFTFFIIFHKATRKFCPGTELMIRMKLQYIYTYPQKTTIWIVTFARISWHFMNKSYMALNQQLSQPPPKRAKASRHKLLPQTAKIWRKFVDLVPKASLGRQQQRVTETALETGPLPIGSMYGIFTVPTFIIKINQM